MKIEIKNRWNGSVIFSHECEDNTVKLTLLNAIASGSDLSGSNLTPIRDDIWAVLSSAPSEVVGLIAALKEGRIDGTAYEGECACLVGTIANIRHVSKNGLNGLMPNSSRPVERFFLGINKGDTPETNQFSKLALEWCEDWLFRMQSVFSPSVKVVDEAK